MDQATEDRLWQLLDSISGRMSSVSSGLAELNRAQEQSTEQSKDVSKRLSSIETHMVEIVRLQERLTNHEEAIGRYGKRLDDHSSRIRQMELWQTGHGDPNLCSFSSQRYDDELKVISDEVKGLQSVSDIRKGEWGISKTVWQWIAGILAAVVVYKMTRGA